MVPRLSRPSPKRPDGQHRDDACAGISWRGRGHAGAAGWIAGDGSWLLNGSRRCGVRPAPGCGSRVGRHKRARVEAAAAEGRIPIPSAATLSVAATATAALSVQPRPVAAAAAQPVQPRPVASTSFAAAAARTTAATHREQPGGHRVAFSGAVASAVVSVQLGLQPEASTLRATERRVAGAHPRAGCWHPLLLLSVPLATTLRPAPKRFPPEPAQGHPQRPVTQWLLVRCLRPLERLRFLGTLNRGSTLASALVIRCAHNRLSPSPPSPRARSSLPPPATVMTCASIAAPLASALPSLGTGFRQGARTRGQTRLPRLPLLILDKACHVFLCVNPRVCCGFDSHT